MDCCSDTERVEALFSGVFLWRIYGLLFQSLNVWRLFFRVCFRVFLFFRFPRIIMHFPDKHSTKYCATRA